MVEEFSAKVREELVTILGTIVAAERYFRARDDANAALHLARVRYAPMAVALETASLTLRALLTPTEPTSPTDEGDPE